MRPWEEQAKNDGNLNPLRQGSRHERRGSHYFLNRFSNAARASIGRAELGVEVSFSIRTLIEYKLHWLRSSFRGIRAGIGCVHSNRLEVSKYVHCRQECNSKPHFGHFPMGSDIEPSSAPHCAQRETVRVPGICSARGPKVSFLTGRSLDCFSRFSPLS